jgi:serine/threonine protein kinase
VNSRTLGAVVREDGPLPPVRVAQIGIEVLGALLAAHHAGVLHRDVKPDNVLLARDGRVVLTDFGIAVLEGDSSLTKTGLLIGTPAFIAPERASGGPAEFASDLWSLGVTLYTAVEGRSPFERAHPIATLSAVMHQHPEPLRLAGPLSPVIFGLLRKDPAQRMSAQEAQTRLRSIVSGSAPQPTMPIDLPAPVPVAVPMIVPSFTPSSTQDPAQDPVQNSVRDPAQNPVPVTAQPFALDPGLVLAPVGGRRRPALAAIMATALAVALTSGGIAWVASNSSSQNPTKPPTSASVPLKETAPQDKPELARLPTRNDPAPIRTWQAPSEPTSRPTPTKPEESRSTPSYKPSGKPWRDNLGNNSGDGWGQNSDQSSGQGWGQNSDQGWGQGSGQG